MSQYNTKAKLVLLTICDYNAQATVKGYLLGDGRLWVEGAGVDGGDSLFKALLDYEPNGNAEFVDHTVTEETRVITLSDLASGDIDNVGYMGRSYLTVDEQAAVRKLAAEEEDAAAVQWVKVEADND